jgi:hypothetical protein
MQLSRIHPSYDSWPHSYELNHQKILCAVGGAMKKIIVYIAFLLLVMFSGNAGAVNVAGYDFDDNAFADVLLSSFGSFVTYDGDLESQIVGYDLGDRAYSFTPGAYVQVGFTDNLVYNGPGYDLAIFEIGDNALFDVSMTLGGPTITYTTFHTPYNAIGGHINVALLDLDDFGFGAGAIVSDIVLGMDNDSTNWPVPSLTAVGAFNSITAPVPEPATMLLLGTGLIGFAGFRRRFKK